MARRQSDSGQEFTPERNTRLSPRGRRTQLSTEVAQTRSDQTVRGGRVDKKEKGFFRRHPILTGLGVAAAAYMAAPLALQLFSNREASAMTPGMDWLSRWIRSMRGVGRGLAPGSGAGGPMGSGYGAPGTLM